MRNVLLALALYLPAAAVYAGHDHSERVLEEMTITAAQAQLGTEVFADIDAAALDAGDIIARLPGVDINRNGPLTAILQYRGSYGDRVALQLDQAPVLSGGPNGMDSPLSYISPLLLRSLSIERGIAPVSAAQESLGGLAKASLDRGDYGSDSRFALSGALMANYNTNGAGRNGALRSTLANASHKVTLLAALDKGNDLEAGDDIELAGTRYQRSRYDLSYGFKSDKIMAEIFTGQVDTENSGTPALPMDIVLIDSDLYGLNATLPLAESRLRLMISGADVYHEMDNFSIRGAPPMTMQYRMTKAWADNLAAQLSVERDSDTLSYRAGLDLNLTEHSADIINPANAGFLIQNFNQVERDVSGLYGELNYQTTGRVIGLGVRLNRVAMAAGDVASSGLPTMMAMAASQLAASFNAADNDEHYDYVDLVIKTRWLLNNQTDAIVELGRKHRAPSYQERFLWLPLAATGGLADGRNYIGNAALKHESADELTLGVDWQRAQFQVSPQIYYRRIDDYIQGVASANAMVNNVAMMMSGYMALQFANIDAEIYGADLSWRWLLNDTWRLAGSFAMVRGKRLDGSDNLYRISPDNARVGVTWHNTVSELTLAASVYARQNKVSAFNAEAETAGYAIVDLSFKHQLSPSLSAAVQLNNIFDQLALNHLGGYNRNSASDINIGQRLPLPGRRLSAALTVNF